MLLAEVGGATSSATHASAAGTTAPMTTASAAGATDASGLDFPEDASVGQVVKHRGRRIQDSDELGSEASLPASEPQPVPVLTTVEEAQAQDASAPASQQPALSQEREVDELVALVTNSTHYAVAVTESVAQPAEDAPHEMEVADIVALLTHSTHYRVTEAVHSNSTVRSRDSADNNGIDQDEPASKRLKTE